MGQGNEKPFRYGLLKLSIFCVWVLSVCLLDPTSRVMDSRALSCGCWKLHSSPLEEQSVLLTADPSLAPVHFVIVKFQFLPLFSNHSVLLQKDETHGVSPFFLFC